MNAKNLRRQAFLLSLAISSTLAVLDVFGDDASAWKVSGAPVFNAPATKGGSK